MNNNKSIHFPTSYQESRTYFRDQLKKVKKIWPTAELDTHFISEPEDLSIDWITADPIKKKEKLVLITTGLHGVEGFVGAAMLDLFLKEFISLLDSEVTGVQFVHVINPWGMANSRRVNQNNVDLNRNFTDRQENFLEDFNPDYKKLNSILNPDQPLKEFWIEDLVFIKNVIASLSREGIQGLRGAVMLGQPDYPAGLYFSGKEFQPETLLIKEMITLGFSSYDEILHFDMHTGYGPRDQMTLVNSPAEERKPDQLTEDFKYPLILSSDPDQFYSMHGDMIDWSYRMKRSEFPYVKHYGTAFEFGTYGDGILKEIKSLRTMIYENQAVYHGALSERLLSRTREEILEMYFPESNHWREKAILDCRQAFSGVLTAEGYL